jgi:hypothetical protein
MKDPEQISARAISLILPADILETCGRCARALKISRAQYIRLAIRRMNGQTLASLRSSRLAAASRKVRLGYETGNGRVNAAGEPPDA